MSGRMLPNWGLEFTRDFPTLAAKNIETLLVQNKSYNEKISLLSQLEGVTVRVLLPEYIMPLMIHSLEPASHRKEWQTLDKVMDELAMRLKTHWKAPPYTNICPTLGVRFTDFNMSDQQLPMETETETEKRQPTNEAKGKSRSVPEATLEVLPEVSPRSTNSEGLAVLPNVFTIGHVDGLVT